MTKSDSCARCGSNRILDNLRLVDTLEEDVRGQTYKNPQARFLKGTEGVSLRAHICGDCGYVDLYALDFEALFEAMNV